MLRTLAAALLAGLALVPAAAAGVRPLADRDHIGSPAIDVIPAGPCVRTEASFTQYVPSSVRYRIRCIATPGPRCRIDLASTAGGAGSRAASSRSRAAGRVRCACPSAAAAC
jgi:hypothetical protein